MNKTIDYYLNRHEISQEYILKEETKNFVETFHENTKNTTVNKPFLSKSISHHLTNPYQMYLDSRNKKNYVFSDEKKLLEPNPFNITLEEAFKNRSSKRLFNKHPLSDQELSDILSSLRTTRLNTSPSNERITISKRLYPSAGALYPIEIYVFHPNKDFSKWNCYNYNPKKHSTTLINEGIDLKTISHALQMEISEIKCGAIFSLTGIFNRSVNKYGAIGYRFSLIEAGCIIQQLGLAGASMNLNSLTWGGSIDNEINMLLKVDGLEENYVTSFLVGHKND